MKHASSARKTAQLAAPLAQPAGTHGSRLAPPAYGIDLLDHGSQGAHGLVIQPKLAVGAANDRYEQEADRVAHQVMRQLGAVPSTSAPPAHQDAVSALIQCAPMDTETTQAPPAVQQPVGSAGGTISAGAEAAIRAASGRGRPLDKTLRPKMERAFGSDFSRIRVHTDQLADQLNRTMQARAFTSGRDIFFRRGEYNTQSTHGQTLLAHELTHVVQQNGAQRSAVQDIQKQTDPHAPSGPQITTMRNDTPFISRKILDVDSTVGPARYQNDTGLVYKSYLVTVTVDKDTDVKDVKLNRRVRAWLMKTRGYSGDDYISQTTGQTSTEYTGVACGKIKGDMFTTKDARRDVFGPWQEDGPPEKEGTNHPVQRNARTKTVSVDDYPGIGGLGKFFNTPAEFHAEFEFTAKDIETSQWKGENTSVHISQNEAQRAIGGQGNQPTPNVKIKTRESEMAERERLMYPNRKDPPPKLRLPIPENESEEARRERIMYDI